MRYEDAYQYQNIMGPLVKLEADYDKQMKEAQTQEGVTVRWDMGLNKKRIAYFTFAQKDTDMRLVTGDELLLRHAGDGGRAAWQCQGTVVRLTAAEEVGLELRSQSNVPVDISHEIFLLLTISVLTAQVLSAATPSMHRPPPAAHGVRVIPFS